MIFNKLISTTAVDSNHLINKNKVLKWYLIYIFDHFNSQWIASLVSLVPNLQILKAVKVQQLSAYVQVSRRESMSLHMQMWAVHTHTQILTHMYLRVIRWTSFQRYRVDPGIWIPKEAACRCPFRLFCRNGQCRMVLNILGSPRLLQLILTFYYNINILVLTDYTKDNFGIRVIAALTWV